MLDNQLSRLQSVLNATARLIFSARKYKAISLLLGDLYWLRVPQRIEFKLAVLTYCCLHSMPYLADELHRVVDIDATTSEVGVYTDTRTTDVSLHHWRSLIFGRGFACMEQSTI